MMMIFIYREGGENPVQLRGLSAQPLPLTPFLPATTQTPLL